MPTDAQRYAALRRIFPDLERARELLDDSIDEYGPGGGGPQSLLPARRSRAAGGLTTIERERGRELLELIDRNGPDVQLTATDRNIIDAIVWRFGRPALFIDGGSFVGDAGGWTPLLEARRPAIEATFGGVGRIEYAEGGDSRVIGTGFVVGEGLVMTNRHVVEVLRSGGRGWSLATSAGPRLDMRAERKTVGPQLFALAEVVWQHPSLDAAILRFATGPLRPRTLALAAHPPAAIDEHAIYVIGHPLPDRDNDPDDIKRIFGTPFGVKRLSPGNLMSLQQGILSHDASTLSGSSGSCVVDLTHHAVLGVHYQGTYVESNQAVALWPLRAELEQFGLRFQ